MVEEVVVDDDDDEVDVVVVDDVVGSVLKNRINIRPEDWMRFFWDFITCRSPDNISNFEFIMFRAYHKYRVLAWFGREGRKGKERKGKEQNGEKVACVGVEPTPSAIRADVLSQLD